MKKTLIIAACLLLVVVLSGCKKAAEVAAEKGIESATGGQADVDIDDNSVTINTNAGSFAAGGNVSLPDDFPADVHVADGTITAATTNTETSGYSVSIQTNESVTSLKDEYESELKKDGWDVTMSLTIQDGATLGAEKDNRTTSVSISKGSDGQTTVILVTATKSE